MIKFCFEKFFLSEWNQKKTRCAIILWILFLTFEYWFLGPYSFVSVNEDANHAITRYLYHAIGHVGGNFLHGVQGGISLAGTLLTDGQHFSLERWLIKTFPLSLALIFHKILVASTTTIGMYLLLRKSSSVPRSEAFFLSAFYSTFSRFMIHFTFYNGLGYGVLPLTLYILVFRSGKKYHLFSSFLLSVLISISISPVHAFPTIFLGTLFLPFFLYPSKIGWRFILSISFLGLTYLANWIDYLWITKEYASSSSRFIHGKEFMVESNFIQGAIPYLNGISTLTGTSFSPLLSLALIVLVATIIKEKRKIRPLIPVFLCIVFFVYINKIIHIIPWQFLKLGFVESIQFKRLAYASLIPLTLMISRFPLTFGKNKTRVWGKLFFVVYLLYNFNLKALAFRGILGSNMKRLHAVKNLAGYGWRPSNQPFRVVTAGNADVFHPNYVWGHNLESLDGFVNFALKNQEEFWYYGIHKQRKPIPFLVGAHFFLHYGTGGNVGEMLPEGNSACSKEWRNLSNGKIDLNLLRLTNVSHIVSYYPLNGKDIKKVSGPEHTIPTACLPSKEKLLKKLSTLRQPDDIYIYSLGSFTPRAYFPSKIFPLKEQSQHATYRYISFHYCSTCAFTNQKKEVGKGSILKLKKVPDGYDIEVDVKREGLFVLNHFMTPWWQVFINGEKQNIFTVNNFQIGLNIKQGKQKLEFRHIILPLSQKIITETKKMWN